MLFNNKGMIDIDLLITVHLILLFTILFTPIIAEIFLNQRELNLKRTLSTYLYNELQHTVEDEPAFSLPYTYIETIDGVEVKIIFSLENEQFLKGCIEWKTYKHENDSVCLYGLTMDMASH